MTTRRVFSLTNILVISVILMACLTISFVTISKLIESERVRFNNLSQKLQNAIKNELESNARVLAMVKFGISQNPKFNRFDFHLLTQVHLSYMPSLKAIKWIPKVSHNDRELFENQAQNDGFPDFKISRKEINQGSNLGDYFPVYFLEPYVKNEASLGIDLASMPGMMATMTKAANTGKTLATPEIKFLTISNDSYGFSLFTPIYYRNSQGYEPPGFHRIKGFLSTDHKIDRLMGQAISRSDATGLNMSIIDFSIESDPQLLFEAESLSTPAWIKFVAEDIIKVGGRSWKLLIVANKEFWARTNWIETILLILFGCLFVISAGMLVIYLINDTVRTKKLVEIRTRKYKSAKHQAEMALESRSIFLANMSHEIRTPLNSIIGYTELLVEDESNSEKKNQLENIKEAGEGLLCIINDILDLSKLESGKLTFNESTIPIRHFLSHTISMYQDLAKRKNNSLNLFISNELRSNYLGDPNRLRQILINLIGNAIKFTENGQVNLRALPHDEGISFEISDTGIGIDSGSLPKIFEHFTQADNSSRNQLGGTGLGLSIVKMLVNQWKGRIDVQSEPEMGTLFTLMIPLIPAADQEDVGPVKTPVVSRQPDSSKPLKVLVCEDNQMNIQLIRTRLSKSGFIVDIAENGLIGFEKFKNESYDFILMDIRMPVMDGVTATLKIRAYEKTNNLRQTPIIAQTANVMKEDIETYIAAGMNSHVAKPILYKQLCKAIESINVS